MLKTQIKSAIILVFENDNTVLLVSKHLFFKVIKKLKKDKHSDRNCSKNHHAPKNSIIVQFVHWHVNTSTLKIKIFYHTAQTLPVL